MCRSGTWRRALAKWAPLRQFPLTPVVNWEVQPELAGQLPYRSSQQLIEPGRVIGVSSTCPHGLLTDAFRNSTEMGSLVIEVPSARFRVSR